MSSTQQNSSELPAGNSPLAAGAGDGFYHCSHCREVVLPSAAQIELAENAPEADAPLKCPHCHKHTVHWQFPAAEGPRQHPQPVSQEAGHKLFAGILQTLEKS